MSIELDTREPTRPATAGADRSPVYRRVRGIVIKATLALVVGATVVLLVVWRSGQAISDDASNDLLVHTVQRSDFESFVSESGDIRSSSNVEIRCRVRSEGGGGTTILEIVEEGTLVEEGDFLVQFDDSALKLILTQQEILLATDETVVIDAQSELDKATQTLNEYRDGLFLVDKETFESELLQAEADLKTAEDALMHSERMYRKGYVSRLQLEAQQVAVEMAVKGVKVAETKLRVHSQFTYQRMISEYEAEIKKQEAALRAAQFTIKLSQQRRDEISEQVARCRVLAPTPGQVVFANDFERQQNIVIEEGAQVREGQIVIRLPNPKEMQVRARINDSKIKQVKVDNPVIIELDVNPNLPVHGAVSKINSFPYPREWYGGPIEYGIEIRILDPPPGLTPGQRAKAKIFVEKLDDVVQVPIQSILEQSGSHYCLVRNQDGNWATRKVSIGSSNGSFVVLDHGVDEGEEVALTPDLLWDQIRSDEAMSEPADGLADSLADGARLSD